MPTRKRRGMEKQVLEGEVAVQTCKLNADDINENPNEDNAQLNILLSSNVDGGGIQSEQVVVNTPFHHNEDGTAAAVDVFPSSSSREINNEVADKDQPLDVQTIRSLRASYEEYVRRTWEEEPIIDENASDFEEEGETQNSTSTITVDDENIQEEPENYILRLEIQTRNIPEAVGRPEPQNDDINGTVGRPAPRNDALEDFAIDNEADYVGEPADDSNEREEIKKE